jgi:dihydrofolate reductase
MRKLVVLTFVSLDGVMQAPGGPQEDTSGGFKYGGWTFPYFDDTAGEVMGQQMTPPFDLLLGRKTYDIFAAHWPQSKDELAKDLNEAKKYVVSHDANFEASWENTEVISGDVADRIKELKTEEGPMLQVHGSGNMIQTLLKNDLIDELWLKTFPVTLASGKRLFAEGTIPAAFELFDSKITPKGVIIANYKRAGDVKTGSFAD